VIAMTSRRLFIKGKPILHGPFPAVLSTRPLPKILGSNREMLQSSHRKWKKLWSRSSFPAHPLPPESKQPAGQSVHPLGDMDPANLGDGRDEMKRVPCQAKAAARGSRVQGSKGSPIRHGVCQAFVLFYVSVSVGKPCS
jgi:hypothetical protein